MELAPEYSFTIGYGSSTIAEQAGFAGTVYNVAQLSNTATSADLSNNDKYPYFSRLTPPASDYVEAIKASLLYYNENNIGWDYVAMLAESIPFTLSLAESFINIVGNEIEIATYQQFLADEEDFTIELTEAKGSGARVFLGFVTNAIYDRLLRKANDFGLIGENYVWYVQFTVTESTFSTPNELSRGAIGSTIFVPESITRDIFLDLWRNADLEKYPSAGDSIPSAFQYLSFDFMLTAANAVDFFAKQNLLFDRNITALEWTDDIRTTTFEGASGPVEFDSNGDRISVLELVYYSPETNSWNRTAKWSAKDGFTYLHDVIWFSNTTDIPDLDIREPFNYWSCKEKDEFTDKTGKTIQLHTPDSDNDIDDIDIHYHCDKFIDCENLSDESSNGCANNYMALFIVFGIITGILILISIVLIVFVIIFGICLQYRRLKKTSPFFLIIILLSVIVGYSSIFAWFGKPHPVACAFQPWLLGLSVVSLVTALTVKNFRLWRIFRFPMKRTKVTDFELLILWCIIMFPAIIILILWSIISTPTAEMRERDGYDHYICVTGGISGEPGGYIFFGIFTGYCALVLLIGALISILARHVPSQFNESKILTISIYNLGFLACVIIPVFLAVQPFNPFIAWILRTVAILYAFTATLVIQFLPMLFHVIIIDKCRNDKTFKSLFQDNSTSTNSPPQY